MISIPRKELEILLEEAARRGAKRALSEVGLSDENAGEDIQDLRSLLSLFRDAQKTFWQTVVKCGSVFFLGALLLGVAGKLGWNLGTAP